MTQATEITPADAVLELALEPWLDCKHKDGEPHESCACGCTGARFPTLSKPCSHWKRPDQYQFGDRCAESDCRGWLPVDWKDERTLRLAALAGGGTVEFSDVHNKWILDFGSPGGTFETELVDAFVAALHAVRAEASDA